MLRTEIATDTKRLTMLIPTALYADLERMAQARQGSSVPELVRSFIRLGLLVMQEEDGTPQSTLVIKQDEREREIFLL